MDPRIRDERHERWLLAQRRAAEIVRRAEERYPYTLGVRNDLVSAVTLPRVDRGQGLSVNATTEGILFATQQFAGSGSNTSGQDGFWYPGKSLRIYASGFLTTIGTAGTITLNWRLDSITGASLGASVAITPIVSITKGAWVFEGWVTCRSVGSSGTIIGSGRMVFGSTVVTATAPGRAWLLPDVSSDATATIDTTANHQVVLTTLMTQAHTMTTQLGFCEVMN